MSTNNLVKMSFPSKSENVAIARVTAAAFAAQLDLTLNDLEEIKVAVSEAISNAVIHGYGETVGEIEFEMILEDNCMEFIIVDHGKGIADIDLARQPSYSSDPERMGLGFVFMESFMDKLTVESEVGSGTKVRMQKKINIAQEH